ncbi:hypothetical protein AGDE_13989 [Angomonas deanei]|uniref:Uncharacterized protein n=1 Tax=Angomonas deanei TaxID=59799 RepID=A0A7G2CE22_9TRYP|nr:hypothetical protein AGDE_13989 [Angomonas deanei]CAD2217635.1 hypothetical protein, conserved [Angomonas deanei]|eukprot:EPY21574.1 hypothetical protein AGDE_13989 [Angomonas deanei]
MVILFFLSHSFRLHRKKKKMKRGRKKSTKTENSPIKIIKSENGIETQPNVHSSQHINTCVLRRLQDDCLLLYPPDESPHVLLLQEEEEPIHPRTITWQGMALTSMLLTAGYIQWTVAPTVVQVVPLGLTQRLSTILTEQGNNSLQGVFPISEADDSFYQYFSKSIHQFNHQNTESETIKNAKKFIQKMISVESLSSTATALLPGLPEVWLDCVCVGYPSFIHEGNQKKSQEEEHWQSLVQVVPSAEKLAAVIDKRCAPQYNNNNNVIWYVVCYLHGAPNENQNYQNQYLFYVLPSSLLVQRCVLKVGYANLMPSARPAAARTASGMMEWLKICVTAVLDEYNQNKDSEEEFRFEVKELPWKRETEVGLCSAAALQS